MPVIVWFTLPPCRVWYPIPTASSPALAWFVRHWILSLGCDGLLLRAHRLTSARRRVRAVWAARGLL
jgi:hypothetical protein